MYYSQEAPYFGLLTLQYEEWAYEISDIMVKIKFCFKEK
jgi:hypothetical protein